MRSREPWRLPAGQSRAVPFLQAAVLFAALCIFARSAALVLAAFLAAPMPAAQTLLHLGEPGSGGVCGKRAGGRVRALSGTGS